MFTRHQYARLANLAFRTNVKFKALQLIWNDLLIQMVQRQAKFHSALALALTQKLADSKANLKNSLEMASKWLRHVLLDQAWTSIISPNGLEGIRCDVIEACLLNKNDFTSIVIEDVLAAMSGAQAEVFTQLMELCDADDGLESMDVDVAADEFNEDAQASSRGWSRPVAVWLPRPIGV
jgi:hypothetical protein